MKIGTLTTGNGVVTTIQMTYLPEFITIPAATALTAIRVNVAGDGVITDLNAAGIASAGNIEKIGLVTNAQTIRLADGIILNKNVTIEITNSAAQTPDVYGWSTSRGGVYVQSISQTIFANSGQEIKNFLNCTFPGAGTNDDFQVTFADGLTQKFNRVELAYLLGFQQNVTNTANDYLVRNQNGFISVINYTPTAQQTIFVQRIAGVKGVVLNSSVN